MRHTPATIATCAAVAGCLALLLFLAAAAHPGSPHWALMSFAVAAFSGPVR